MNKQQSPADEPKTRKPRAKKTVVAYGEDNTYPETVAAITGSNEIPIEQLEDVVADKIKAAPKKTRVKKSEAVDVPKAAEPDLETRKTRRLSIPGVKSGGRSHSKQVSIKAAEVFNRLTAEAKTPSISRRSLYGNYSTPLKPLTNRREIMKASRNFQRQHERQLKQG